MKASLPAFAGAIFILAGLTVHCSSSDDSGSGGTSSGGSGGKGGATGGGASGSAGKGGSAGANGGSTSEGGAAGASLGGAPAENAGEGGAAGAPVEVTTPVLGAIADIAVTQNTVATPVEHVTFTVTDPGGVTGLTATATSANTALATTSAVTCTSGSCSFDVNVTPTDAASLSINVQVQNPRGGSAGGQFALSIAPLTVTVGTDTGAGSLRETVGAASAGDVVVFDPGVSKITLASELDLPHALTLTGPNSSPLNIDCGNAVKCLVTTGDTVSLSGLLLTNAQTGIAAQGGHLTLKSVSVGVSANGLSIVASSASTIVDAVSCSFSGNTANGVTLTSTATSTATGNFLGCTASGNAIGFALITTAAGQTVDLKLPGGNQAQNNTQAGILVEMDGGLGTATLEMTPTNGNINNDISMNAVGVQRLGTVPSSALQIDPSTQVSNNTVDFSPAWP